MSLARLERAIVAGARAVLKNPKLTAGALMEWSTDEQTVKKNAQEGEVVLFVPDPGVWIAVLQKDDRRGQ